VSGIAIGVSRSGRIVYERAFGHSAGTPGAELRAVDVFRIASVTKQFTAAAILQLADRKRLSLDDRADHWVANWPADREPVTIRQLLTHTAGVREVRFSGGPTPPVLRLAHTRQNTVAAYIVADSAEFASGTSFRYSNAGYFLLGRIVERASGLTLAEY
jgi:CubicO group peptidase (beta-lactamase class C family)